MSPEQEKYIFESFRELYKNFPDGIIIKSDKPDYLITLPNKIIGVEITQVYIDNNTDGSINEKRKESLRRQLGHSLCGKLGPIIPYKFLLSIDFGKKDFTSNQINQIVKICETYIKRLKFPEHPITSIDIGGNYGELPEQIDNMNLFYHPKISESLYVETAGGAVPNFTTKHLQAILDKKNRSVKKYQLCDEYWLLIEEGTFRSDNFDSVQVEDIETSFSKIFIYRHANQEIVQVK